MKRSVAARQAAPYTNRVKWAAHCGVLLALTCWAGLASAHENQEFHLAGARFCVDSASAQVVLDLPSPARAAGSRSRLERDLLEALTAALARGGVAYEVRDRCVGARDYALLVADVRYLDPATYVGFGDGAHNYTLFLQVGGYRGVAAVRRDRRLLTNRYNAWLSEIYAEGDAGRPFEPFVVGEAARLAGGLAAFWWEDNPRRSLRAARLPPLLGGALALLVGGALWRALRRRRTGGPGTYSSG